MQIFKCDFCENTSEKISVRAVDVATTKTQVDVPSVRAEHCFERYDICVVCLAKLGEQWLGLRKTSGRATTLLDFWAEGR